MITETTVEVPFEDTYIPCQVWAEVTYTTYRCDTDRGVQEWETANLGCLHYDIPEQPEHCRAWLNANEAEIIELLERNIN